MKIFKKLTGFILAAAMTLSALPLSAAAAKVTVAIVDTQPLVIVNYEDCPITAKVTGAKDVTYKWQVQSRACDWFDLEDGDAPAWSGMDSKTLVFLSKDNIEDNWTEESCQNWSYINVRCKVTANGETYYSNNFSFSNLHTIDHAKALVEDSGFKCTPVSPKSENSDKGFINVKTEAGKNVKIEFEYTPLDDWLKSYGFSVKPKIMYYDGKEKETAVKDSNGKCSGTIKVNSDEGILAWAGVDIMHGETLVSSYGKYYVIDAEKGYLYGTAELAETVVCGAEMSLRLSEFPATLQYNGKLSYEWQYTDDNYKYEVVSAAQGGGKKSLFMSKELFKKGRKFRCVITADEYDDCLTTNWAVCTPGGNYSVPGQFSLGYDKSGVYVYSSSAAQEYVITTYQTENPDWSGAVKGNGGKLYFSQCGGSPIASDTLYYVYTRYLPDDYYSYGVKYTNSYVYTGVSEKIKALEFDYSQVTLKPGGTFKLTVKSVPDNIPTFMGVRGSNWFSNTNTYCGREIVSLYADAGCTEKLKPDEYYKSVYIKANESHNDVEVAAETTVGYNDLKIAFCKINITNPDGETYKISNISYSNTPITLANGVSGEVGMDIYPIDGVAGNYSSGYFSDLNIRVTDSKGNSVSDKVLSVTPKSKGMEPTLVVQTNYDTPAGTYTCDVVVPWNHSNANESRKYSFTINVECTSVAPTVSFAKKSLPVPVGESTATSINTDESSLSVTYSSSDPSVATVDKDGKVTSVGTGTATITAVVTTPDGRKSETKSEVVAVGDKTAAAAVQKQPVVSAKEVKSTSVTLRWDNKTKATGYRIQQYVNGKWKTVKTIDSKKTHSCTISGLTSGSTYTYRVLYRTASNGKEVYKVHGKSVSVTTPLPKIKNFTASSIKNSKATLKWDKSAKADGYIIEIYKNGKWEQLGSYKYDKSSTQLSSLKKNATYKVRICSYTISQNGITYGDYSTISFKAK